MNGFTTEKPLPYQLYIKFEFFKDGNILNGACGGVLIASDLVITAHHCFDDVKDGPIHVYGNLYDLRRKNYPNRRIQVNMIPFFAHP